MVSGNFIFEFNSIFCSTSILANPLVQLHPLAQVKKSGVIPESTLSLITISNILEIFQETLLVLS